MKCKFLKAWEKNSGNKIKKGTVAELTRDLAKRLQSEGVLVMLDGVSNAPERGKKPSKKKASIKKEQ